MVSKILVNHILRKPEICRGETQFPAQLMTLHHLAGEDMGVAQKTDRRGHIAGFDLSANVCAGNPQTIHRLLRHQNTGQIPLPAELHEKFAVSGALGAKAKIIAEDLGFITEDVRDLLTDTGFPGMKMLHFAFYDPDSENLPRMYESRNCVV